MKTIILFFVAVIVIAVVGGILKTKKTMAAMKQVSASPKFQAIADHIFAKGNRPTRIVITFDNEIFYGPIQGEFVQVPGSLIPNMDANQRHGLGGAFEKKYAYTYNLCNSGLKSGFGAAPADTGVAYIDSHADVLLISKNDGGSW